MFFFCVSSAGHPGIVNRVTVRFVCAPSPQGNVSGSCGKQLELLEDRKVGFLSAGCPRRTAAMNCDLLLRRQP